MQIVYLIVSGFLSGAIGALMGLGGGIVLVPILTLIFGLPVTEAVGTSLLGVVAVSTAAAIDYLKSGRADLELGMTLETVTVVGALSGALLSGIIPNQVVYLLFGAVLVYAAYGMARPREINDKSGIEDYPRNIPAGLGLSFLAGNVSSLLGVGGGVIKVPVMNLVMGMPLKIATATSNYMVGITAASGAIIYLLRGDVDLNKASAIIIGIFAGSRLGVYISYRIHVKALRLLFVIVMLFTAYKMIIKGL